MVCPRCIKVIGDELQKMSFPVKNIELGTVVLATDLTPQQRAAIKAMLEENGFELIDDKRSQLIEAIKTLIIQNIHHSENQHLKTNTSEYLSQQLGYDYSYLSHLFSTVEGITIERYIILQKIEKIKELLVYNELTLSEIAYRLGYSSVQYLSNQFKKVTGLSPSHFKKLKEQKRKPLDQL